MTLIGPLTESGVYDHNKVRAVPNHRHSARERVRAMAVGQVKYVS